MSEKKYKTDEELQAKIDEYFDTHIGVFVDEEGNTKVKAPTVSGLALFLGFADRQSLYNYRDNPLHTNTIKRAITRMESFAEEQLFNSAKTPTGAIFWLKNHRWSDKQEISHSVNDKVIEELKKLYE